MSRLWTIAGLVALSGFMGAGCSVPERHVPTAIAARAYGTGEPAVGDPLRNFAFTLNEGTRTTLVRERARVTVLAFPDDPDWPDCDAARELSDMARNAHRRFIDVLVISVGHPQAECAEALERVAGCEMRWPCILLVCDPHGGVRRLYGESAGGHYYLLNNYQQVSAIGELSDFEGLHAATEDLVRRIYDVDKRTGMHEWWH